MFYLVLLFLALFLGLRLLFRCLLRLPSRQSGKNLKLQTVNRVKLSTRLFNALVKPLIKPISLLIRVQPAQAAEMTQMLRRAGLEMTPQEYYARAIVCAVLTLPASALMLALGLPQLMPITLILSIVVYFHFMTDMKDKLKDMKDRIEDSLPSFIRSILYRIDQSGRESGGAIVQVDLTAIFEDYLRVANDVFYYDVAILVTEMKAMDIQTALRNFDDRVGLPEVSFLVSALISLERGEQQRDTLFSLAKDMDIKARENIRKELAKRPGKVKMATIPMVVISIASLLYVIVSHLFSSIGGLF